MTRRATSDTAKERLRRQARQIRTSIADASLKSHLACEHLLRSPVYRQARTVLWYVSCHGELATHVAIGDELATSGRRIAVPFCTLSDTGEPMLALVAIQRFDELTIGKWGILEPNCSLRNDPQRTVLPAQLDLVVLPGLAFDMRGRRLGSGMGYYDRLLRHVRNDCVRIGLAFHRQMVPQVPTEVHDQPLHAIVTDRGYQPIR